MRIEGKKCLKKILFAPEPQFIDDPVAPVIEGEQNIVHVDDDAGVQSGQYLEEEIVNVAANFYRVRTVDEKEIAGAELREKLQLDVFHFFFH